MEVTGAEGYAKEILRSPRGGGGAYRTLDSDSPPYLSDHGGTRYRYHGDNAGGESGPANWSSEYSQVYKPWREGRTGGGSLRIAGAAGVRRPAGVRYVDDSKKRMHPEYPERGEYGFGLSYGRRLRDQDILPAT